MFVMKQHSNRTVKLTSVKYLFFLKGFFMTYSFVNIEALLAIYGYMDRSEQS